MTHTEVLLGLDPPDVVNAIIVTVSHTKELEFDSHWTS